MTDLYKKWAHASCYFLCGQYGDCDFCKKVYKMDQCPKSYAFDSPRYDGAMEKTARFVKLVTERLYELEEDKLPFDILDMDIINVLEEQDDC